MAFQTARIKEASKLLSELIDDRLAGIIERISANPESYRSDIPEADSADFTIEEIASLVARTSNRYQRAAADSGYANAKLKIAEGNYKRKYKASLAKGRNTAEREAAAVEASADEAMELNLIEAIVELVEKEEAMLRIASESARKLLDKVATMDIASRRESAGFYMDKDFN